MRDFTVSLQKCQSYDQPQLKEAIKKLLEPLGGIEAFVKPGSRVLLKPNMLSCKNPDKAATPHPAIVEEIARLCISAGATVKIGDSPPAVFGRTEEFWEKTGFAAAAQNSGAELISFEKDAKAPISFFSNGQTLTTPIVKTFFMSDVIINLPKMKTHNLTRITGALKNLFGLVPGLLKAGWHKAFPRPVEFSRFMTDLAHQLPCSLTIMDGIDAMDGQGPAGGRVVKAGVLIASADPVAVDMTFCRLAGLEPLDVPMLQQCRKLNWGPASLEQISFSNCSPEDFLLDDYQVPRLPPISMVPDFIINLLRRLLWAGPALIEGKCIKCGRCREICPADAITITKDHAVFDRQKCISCFCCMEVCPVDAIEMKSSTLLSLGLKMRGLKRKLKGKKT
jgi:uncharacterized protein (DUF362 family)/Pyruvate/2-oxoacid:ferredoxin oxidoreductase delta subunit